MLWHWRVNTTYGQSGPLVTERGSRGWVLQKKKKDGFVLNPFVFQQCFGIIPTVHRKVRKSTSSTTNMTEWYFSSVVISVLLKTSPARDNSAISFSQIFCLNHWTFVFTWIMEKRIEELEHTVAELKAEVEYLRRLDEVPETTVCINWGEDLLWESSTFLCVCFQQDKKCPQGHELVKVRVKDVATIISVATCDECGAVFGGRGIVFLCDECDYSLCVRCTNKKKWTLFTFISYRALHWSLFACPLKLILILFAVTPLILHDLIPSSISITW